VETIRLGRGAFFIRLFFKYCMRTTGYGLTRSRSSQQSAPKPTPNKWKHPDKLSNSSAEMFLCTRLDYRYCSDQSAGLE
jgi:hypothetical protein